VLALQRENKEILWGSMVKETMKRKRPSFNETYYGFRTFSHLLEDAQRRGIVTLRRDQRSAEANGARSGRRRRGRGARRGRPAGPLVPGAAPDAAASSHDEEEDAGADDAGPHEEERHGPGEPAAVAAGGERSQGFSLFSWLRRDQASEEKKP
jgi:hypothetical protein